MPDENHNLNCVYAAEIVSYLYDEIGKSEKAVFETHLAKCRDCADELADFSFARFAVKDWRDTEFTRLKTPLIEIPFETKPSKETVSADSISMLANLRRIFSRPTAWATSGAALAIFAGLFLTATTFFQPDLIAEKGNINPDNDSVLSSVKTESKPQPEPSIVPETVNSVIKLSNLSPKNDAPEKREIARQDHAPENQKNSVVKVSVNSPKNDAPRENSENIAVTGLKNTNKSAPKNSARVNRPVPTLNSFD
ncbi:MAG TPA: zf-HC2 domain-containing protein, partial [Pyrinomonadaceae bacterium]